MIVMLVFGFLGITSSIKKGFDPRCSNWHPVIEFTDAAGKTVSDDNAGKIVKTVFLRVGIGLLLSSLFFYNTLIKKTAAQKRLLLFSSAEIRPCGEGKPPRAYDQNANLIPLLL